MPLYHFNLSDGRRDPDVEGTELSGPEEARVQAITFAGAYLRDNPALIKDDTKFQVDVVDDDGAPVVRIVIHAETPERPLDMNANAPG